VRTETELPGQSRQLVVIEPTRSIDFQQLDEVSGGELHEPVRRPHAVWMRCSRRQLEAETLIAGRGMVEIGHRYNNMVERSLSFHIRPPRLPGAHDVLPVRA
jgi:hypothetical protein